MERKPSQSITFRCPRDLFDKLAREASHEERDVSWVIRRALLRYLERGSADGGSALDARPSAPGTGSTPARKTVARPLAGRQAVLNKDKGMA